MDCCVVVVGRDGSGNPTLYSALSRWDVVSGVWSEFAVGLCNSATVEPGPGVRAALLRDVGGSTRGGGGLAGVPTSGKGLWLPRLGDVGWDGLCEGGDPTVSLDVGADDCEDLTK